MKKYLSILLPVLILAAALTMAACTPSSDPADDTGSTASTTATEPASVLPTDTEPDTEPATEAPTAGIEFEDVVEEPETRPAVGYDDTHAWVFMFEDDAARWSGSGAQISVEQGELTVRPNTHDPIVQIALRPDEQIDASEYRYIAYRYAAQATQPNGVFFVSSTNHPSFSDDGLLFFNVDRSGEFVDLVMDMSRCNFWVDMVTAFRIDPINGGSLDEGACIRIDRVGFFRSEEDAREFLDYEIEIEDKSSILRGEMSEAFLPRGVWYTADFLLSAREDNATLVRMNGKVVPLSYVNPVGYAFYEAVGSGTYTTAAVTDDGTPLGFVQARGLLTGKTTDAVLTKDDLTALVMSLSLDTVTTEEAAKAVEGGTIRDLCAALTAYMKLMDYDVYKSVIRRSPILDGRAADALKLCWRIGLLDYDDLLDADDPLTAGRAALIVKRMILACLGQPVLPSAVDPDAMMIGCWYSGSTFTPADVKLMRASGINMIVSTGALEGSSLPTSLKMCDEYGISVLIYNYAPSTFNPMNPVSPALTSGEFYDYKSYLGNTIYDEPGSDDFNKIGKMTDYYLSVLPGKVPFYNLLPMYANAAQLKYGASAAAIEYYDPDPELYRKYVESYAQKVNTNYICVDIYPNRSSGKIKATYDGYLKNMDIFASVCREYDRDFWLYVQTTGLDGIRVPDYDDMRWQMYVGLSFGVRTFIHFTYNTYDNKQWTESMVSVDGTPTTVYDAAQKANLEVAALSEAYLKYRNVGAYTVNAKSNIPYMAFDNQYEGIAGMTVDTKLPLLVGCAKPKADGASGYAFTLVNMTPLSKRTSGDIHFTLENAHTVTVWQGGVPTVIEPSDGIYTVQLAVAEGVFVTVE